MCIAVSVANQRNDDATWCCCYSLGRLRYGEDALEKILSADHSEERKDPSCQVVNAKVFLCFHALDYPGQICASHVTNVVGGRDPKPQSQ